MIADSERHVCMITIATKSEMHRDWNDNWSWCLNNTQSVNNTQNTSTDVTNSRQTISDNICTEEYSLCCLNSTPYSTNR